MFTNALLSNHDITSLIRDTESHERALFSVPPPPPPASKPPPPIDKPNKRRKTVFNVASGEVTTGPPSRGPRRHTAVAAVLGGDLHDQLRVSHKGDVDVNILLRGAEKLCGVYELPGATERIANLRARYKNGLSTAGYYEEKVQGQAATLANLNRDWMDEDEEEEEKWTEEDLRREEEEARELEGKKRELQARLRAMEKDYAGLMRM